MKLKKEVIIPLLIVLIWGFLGLLSGEFFQEQGEEGKSKIGLILFIILVFALILLFILPKTKYSKHLKINQNMYTITNVLGLFTGIFGLLAIFIWPPEVVKSFLWKLIIMPYVLIWIYCGIITIGKKTSDIYDEKQDYDMTKGAAVTMAGLILVMGFVISPLLEKEILNVLLLMPFYLFTAVLIFSASTLFFFKKY